MNRMEDKYKITYLNTYKTLLNEDVMRGEVFSEDHFEMLNMLEGEIEHVVERMIFENTYEIFPS